MVEQSLMYQNLLKQAGLWLLLLACSLPLCWLLHEEGLPAAFLIGSILCGIAFSVTNANLKVTRKLFQCAQSLIGCAVAKTITASILLTIFSDWAIMLVIVAASVAAGAAVGWTLMRCRVLPGTTAAWGSTPGAASAMVAMAEEFGADARLVALMQYLRVLVVVLTASMVSRFVLGTGASENLPVASLALGLEAGLWQQLLVTLGVAVAGLLVGLWLKIPAGAMLVPMILGAVLHSCNYASMYQPFWLQACASVLLGWYVGLGFNRAVLVSAFRLLPRLLLSSVMLIGLCGVSAWLLTVLLGTDPLTAYLATSPGGLDSVILIAMGSNADTPFVVAVQTLRLFVVILVGPGIARLICRHA